MSVAGPTQASDRRRTGQRCDPWREAAVAVAPHEPFPAQQHTWLRWKRELRRDEEGGGWRSEEKKVEEGSDVLEFGRL